MNLDWNRIAKACWSVGTLLAASVYLVSCNLYPRTSLVESREVPTLVGTLTGFSSDVDSIAVSDDGSLLSIGGENGVTVYSTETFEREWSLSYNGIEYVAFANNNQNLVLAEDAGLVIIVDGQSGNIQQALDTKPGNSPSSARLNPQGNLLAIGIWGGPVMVWDVDRQKHVNLWIEHYQRRQSGGQSTIVDWTSDGTLLAAGGWYTEVLMWDVESGELVHEFENDFHVSNIALSPDDTYLAAISWETNQMAIWDIENEQLHKEWQFASLTEAAAGGPIVGVSWSPDGALLAGATGNGKVFIWETTDYSVIKVLEAPEQRSEGRTVHSIAWSPDGSILYTGSYEATVVVWDVATGELIRTLQGTDLP